MRRYHAWSNRLGRVAYKEADADFLVRCYDCRLVDVDNVLIEIAGSTVHRGAGHASLHNTLRWMIFNAARVQKIVTELRVWTNAKVWVAPSAKWTLGYSEAERHAIAQVTAPNHDLRECEAMIAFATTNPDRWTTLDYYLEHLL